MNIAFFSAQRYEKHYFDEYNQKKGHQIRYIDAHLNEATAPLAQGSSAVCVFVNDSVNAAVIAQLAALGVKLIAARSAGFNHIDIDAARAHSIPVVRVPAYSPYAVAEHTVAMILTLNRKTHRAYNRIREGNFALEGLMGFDLFGKTAGVVGTGKIGAVFAKIMLGFECEVLAHDLQPNSDLKSRGVNYVELKDLLRKSDIVSLHCPLTPATYHLINPATLAAMKHGAMLINTSRGALVDTRAAIESLKNGHLGHLGLDVYEEEADLFFEDLSGQVLQDDVFARLLTFPNVLVTGHQAFFTQEALRAIAMTTLDNASDIEKSGESKNQVRAR
jgi:D-lactate dehydrogenase